MNLTGSPNTLGEQSQELTQSTAERLSDLAQATEQVYICKTYYVWTEKFQNLWYMIIFTEIYLFIIGAEYGTGC